MQLQEQLPWADPLAMAQGIPDSETCWALLHSGLHTPYTGRYSIIALRPKLEVSSHDFTELESMLGGYEKPYDNAWFGYLGYGLKNALEKLPKDEQGLFHAPPLWMVNYGLLLVFDHDIQHIEVWAENREMLQHIPEAHWPSDTTPPPLDTLTSNMTKAEYLDKVATIKEAIYNGDLSQANLTRKFNGQFMAHVKPLDLFTKLCATSPAPYSCFLKHHDTYIVSSSPERFLTVTDEGIADSRPIKGSAARYPQEPQRDADSRDALEKSEKDKAENLMIVDLMRNDFSRACETGSVRVEKLFDITSYSTIHHMASTVRGKLRDEASALDLVKACFPPGSMTGTPKIKAMELCTQLEKVERGIYSGAIGWFGGDGSADLSVVIRTIITDGLAFEFQVGGAVIADSDPEAEWQETMIKAKAIATTLGIDMTRLEGI